MRSEELMAKIMAQPAALVKTPVVVLERFIPVAGCIHSADGGCAVEVFLCLTCGDEYKRRCGNDGYAGAWRQGHDNGTWCKHGKGIMSYRVEYYVRGKRFLTGL